MDSFYKEEILDHYQHPQNFGILSTVTHQASQKNPFCGDEITLQLFIENNQVRTVSFTGTGCAISIAAASILTEAVKGKAKEELTSFSQRDMLDLLSIPISETRKKCALLAWATLQNCVKKIATNREFSLCRIK